MQNSHSGILLAVFGLMLISFPAYSHQKQMTLPPGIVSVDTVSPHDLQAKITAGYRPEVPWDEAFGQFVDVDAYAPNLDVDSVYAFVQDITNLKYWTMSQYAPQPLGTLKGRNRYVATELLPPQGLIYFTEEKHPEVKTVDWWVGPTAAGSDPNDIWMHYYVRILDAKKFIGKPGVIINWVNFGHQKFENNPDLYQGFRGMRIAHAIERDNLIKILNWKAAGHTGPITQDVLNQIGVINIQNTAVMDIWTMVMSAITPTVTWENLYGSFISSHFFVLDVDYNHAWEYLKNLRNMNDWTVATRKVTPFCGGFVGIETLSPTGTILGDTDISEPSKTMDIKASNTRFFWQFGNEPWMTSSFRILDAADSVGKVGTVVVWTTFHHANYDSLPQLKNEWKYLPARHELEMNNLKLLLGSSQP